MVQVKLRGQVTASDVEEMKRAYAAIQRLSVGLHPSAPAASHLTAVLWVMRMAIRNWTGEEVDHPLTT